MTGARALLPSRRLGLGAVPVTGGPHACFAVRARHRQWTLLRRTRQPAPRETPGHPRRAGDGHQRVATASRARHARRRRHRPLGDARVHRPAHPLRRRGGAGPLALRVRTARRHLGDGGELLAQPRGGHARGPRRPVLPRGGHPLRRGALAAGAEEGLGHAWRVPLAPGRAATGTQRGRLRGPLGHPGACDGPGAQPGRAGEALLGGAGHGWRPCCARGSMRAMPASPS